VGESVRFLHAIPYNVVSTKLGLKEFGRLFEDFRRTAFRLETLDSYLVPEEEEIYARFLKGETPPPSVNEDWCQLVRRNTRSGKSMERVHVISNPPSQYVKFEIAWGYAHSAAAGEKVSLLDRRNVPEDKAALSDFWLFDGRLLVLMEYDQDGRFLGVNRETDPAVVATHVDAARVLQSLSFPLSQYLEKNPIV
jgi:hypothetical protein